MKRQNKLISQEQDQLAARQQQQQAASPQEFASVEEMLRHDALHTPVPPTIAHRLEESVRDLPPPPGRGWWRRFFGG
ncbi:MAG TPA: hypothetical protein PKI20_06010 [Verrucomicrobiota bacterium]|jgi:hypothetical protein|nr:hypothetical protein [Verrucomicrobiota bacterium]HQL77189.1 hypothetical protein [Verrucomicrobiota bacterium]